MIELTQEQRGAIKADSESGFGANVGDTQRLLAGYTRLEQECERLRAALRKIESETAATWVCDVARDALSAKP